MQMFMIVVSMLIGLLLLNFLQTQLINYHEIDKLKDTVILLNKRISIQKEYKIKLVVEKNQEIDEIYSLINELSQAIVAIAAIRADGPGLIMLEHDSSFQKWSSVQLYYIILIGVVVLLVYGLDYF